MCGGGAVCVHMCARSRAYAWVRVHVRGCVCVSFILFPVVMLATGYEPVSTAVKYLVYVLGVRTFQEGSREPTAGPERLYDPQREANGSIPRAGARHQCPQP